MKYLLPYLVIGVVVLAAVLIQHNLMKRTKPSPELRELLAQIHGKPSTALWFVEKVVIPPIVGLLVVAAWPIAIVMGVKNMFAKPPAEMAKESREFAVTQEDLDERLLITEVERREQVSDPLGAVPALPFGHLHAAWVSFRDSLDAGDEVWSFATTWTSAWGSRQKMAGYAAVHEGQIGPHFVTLERTLEHDETTDL